MPKKDFLEITDLTNDELKDLLDFTSKLKENPDEYRKFLSKKQLGMIFEKRSTRTRVSFETGIYELGGTALFLSSQDMQLGRGESIPDTARVLSRYLDIIMARVYKHDTVSTLAKYSRVPVINGLSDLAHPCQALADYFTILETFGETKGVNLTYVGDGNNVAHSLMLGAPMLKVNMTVVTPKGYEPDKAVTKQANELAAKAKTKMFITNSIDEGLAGANAVYTDVWTSMGQEAEEKERIKTFTPYQINKEAMKKAEKNAIFLHCLPAHRGQEVTDEVVDSEQSRVFDQAENRKHAQKALMVRLLT